MTLPETVEEFIKEVDDFFDRDDRDFKNFFDRVSEALKKYDPDSKNVALLWRASKVAYKAAVVAESANDTKTRKNFLLESESLADKALAIDENCGDAHEWKAYSCGKISSLLSAKEKIMKGKLMQNHLEQACKLKPDACEVHFAYGRWAMEVAALSWIERKIASTLFDKVPEASYEDAIKHFEDAGKIKPDWKSNYYYTGKCLVALKNYKDAIASFDKAVDAPIKDEEDRIVEKDLLSLQKKYASYR